MNSFEPIFWSIVFIESASAHSFLCVRLQLAIESGNYCFAGSKESLFGRSISSPFNGLLLDTGSPHCPNTRGVWYTDWVDSSTSDLLLTSLRSTFSKGSSLICISLFSVFFAFQNISTTRKKFRYSFLISIYGKSRKIAKAKRIFGDNFASIILVNIAIKIIFGFQTKPNEFCWNRLENVEGVLLRQQRSLCT